MEYKFRKITESDNSIIAGIIRKNLEQFGLDIPGTSYFDANLDHLSDCYEDEKLFHRSYLLLKRVLFARVQKHRQQTHSIITLFGYNASKK